MSPNVLNGALPSGDILSMGVLENAKMNEERAASDDGAPVAPNILNYSLPVGGGLSMIVVEIQ